MSRAASRALPEELVVGRGDPVYMAHAYLTKVPVTAIVPFIEAYCPAGGSVLDPFAGSGMTGVAAAMTGRSAVLSDISVLGRHIGSNYVNLVLRSALESAAELVIKSSREQVGPLYDVVCAKCDNVGQLAKTVWSAVVACSVCGLDVNYYESMKAADWNKKQMVCPACSTAITSKNRRVGEAPVVDYINCSCSPKQLEQRAGARPSVSLDGLPVPDVAIGADRQMYQASALGKSGMVTVASFYSDRNLAVLASLHKAIGDITDALLRSKLLFAFTASLTRASKRYQWSRQRPLNAANANYYVAPVFYEWNVYELFGRKVEAAAKSDAYIREARSSAIPPALVDPPEVIYNLASADALPLADAAVDYVFTDPPFGSNLFYADMALFQEGWLDAFTDESQEAVIDRRGSRSAGRYEDLLTRSLAECARVLKPGGRVSLVFGNSSGKVWALLQRAIGAAGLAIVPDDIVILNKGQRSVKGLASGFEAVATLDLVLTMEAREGPAAELSHPSHQDVLTTVRSIARGEAATPSHVYLELLRSALNQGWDLSDLDLSFVTSSLLAEGWELDEKTGKLLRPAA